MRSESLDPEARAEAAEARLRDSRVDLAIVRAAHKRRLKYPDIAPSLLDRSRIRIDPETGVIEGVEEELDRLARDRPGLADAPQGAGSPPREGPRRIENYRPQAAETTSHAALVEELRATGRYV